MSRDDGQRLKAVRLCGGIHVRAGLEKNLDQSGLTGGRGKQESRPAVTVPGIHLGASFDEGSRDEGSRRILPYSC